MHPSNTNIKIMQRKLLLLLLLMLFTLGVIAQKTSLEQPNGSAITTIAVDRIIHKLMDTAGVTGLYLGVINNDNPIYVKSYGYKNTAIAALNDTSTCLYAA